MRGTALIVLAGVFAMPGVSGAADTGAQGYQVTPGHNAYVAFSSSWGPSLKVLWQTTLDGNVSYPMFQGGHVFALVAGSPNEIVTLDAATGQVIGKLSAGTNSSQGIAYDRGKIFSVDFNGTLTAYSVNAQKSLWSLPLPGQYAFSSAPSALNGIVYVGGAGSGGTLYAVDEVTGKLRWTQPVANGDNSSPAVTNIGVYVSYPCQYYAFMPVSGKLLWHYSGGCDGGGGNTVVVGGAYAYVRDPVGSDLVFNAATGATVATFGASAPPVIAPGGLGYFLDNGSLSAIFPTTSRLLWEFTGDGQLTLPPLAVNRYVVAPSGSGKVYVLNGLTGAILSSLTLSGAASSNLGAGGGIVFVPVGNTLVALGSTT